MRQLVAGLVSRNVKSNRSTQRRKARAEKKESQDGTTRRGNNSMKRVTGIGGIFFKGQDAEALRAWYREHLGIEAEGDSGCVFEWREAAEPEQMGQTVWSVFAGHTKYFEPSNAPFMINYRVSDLRALLDQLRAEGVTVDDKLEEHEYGKFGWIMDPEGNRIELWEPPKE